MRFDMQQVNPGNETLRQWIRAEHHRLHCVEGWPDSPRKEAALKSTQSVLARLTAVLAQSEAPQCMVCSSRRAGAAVLKLVSTSPAPRAITRLAA